MNTKPHTCRPYLSPAQLPKQASLDVKTDGEGREKDRRNFGRVKPCFFTFFFSSSCFHCQWSENKLGMPKVNHLLMLRKLLQKHPVPVPPATGSIKSLWLICFLPVRTLDLPCISRSSSTMGIDFCLNETPPLLWLSALLGSVFTLYGKICSYLPVGNM